MLPGLLFRDLKATFAENSDFTLACLHICVCPLCCPNLWVRIYSTLHVDMLIIENKTLKQLDLPSFSPSFLRLKTSTSHNDQKHYTTKWVKRGDTWVPGTSWFPDWPISCSRRKIAFETMPTGNGKLQTLAHSNKSIKACLCLCSGNSLVFLNQCWLPSAKADILIKPYL
jgi:hypothetical protein